MSSRELVEYLDSVGLIPYSYSGRGMYGRSCIGVNADSWQEFACSMVDGDHQEFGVELSELFRTARTDSMGLGMVFYWPYQEWLPEYSSQEVD